MHRQSKATQHQTVIIKETQILHRRYCKTNLCCRKKEEGREREILRVRERGKDRGREKERESERERKKGRERVSLLHSLA